MVLAGETADDFQRQKRPETPAPKVILEGQDMPDFEPIMEAELPQGFPGPTPVGQIKVKRYPSYRMAQVGTEQGNAFWTLFRHISRQGIAMTTPVQMDYDTTEAAEPRRRSMAFLYGSPDLGSPGADGRVRVVDVPPMTVVSIGVRGATTPQKVIAARDQLLGWLAVNRAAYLPDGPMRVLGYNSPFVPAKRRYFEVQIPVKPIGDAPWTERQ